MFLVPNSGLGYWISTVHPLSRLPVFLMGIFAGILCIRINEGDENPVLGCGGAVLKIEVKNCITANEMTSMLKGFSGKLV